MQGVTKFFFKVDTFKYLFQGERYFKVMISNGIIGLSGVQFDL